jgi:hypothetical protein
MADKIQTNLNTSPYWDDFDETKQYVKVLFKPSVAVQTRELNQIQTMLQQQIANFGSHVFKEGSIVDGVAITYNSAHPYVRLNNLFSSNVAAAIDTITEENLIVSANTGVRAVSNITKTGFLTQYPDTNRLYLSYLTTGKDGSNNDVSTFESGETLTIYNGDQSKLGTLDSNNIVDTIDVVTANSTVNAIGTAYSATTSDGVIFQKGYFSKVLPQTVLVSEYDTNTANKVLGFDTSESIVEASQDESLTDNAAGQPNAVAPGADRLKLSPVLKSYDKTAISSNSSFFTIAEFNDTTLVQESTGSDYDVLGDALAKTISEESGDYVVKPFPVETLTHASNSNLMNYEVSPGIGYISGHRVEFLGAKKIEANRAVETDEAQAQIITANYGNYVVVDEFMGNFDINDISEITIYDSPQNAISTVSGSGSAPSGNAVGTANIRSAVYSSGTKGTPECQYRLYLFNINMNSGKSFSNDAKSFYISGSFGKAKADAVLENSKSVIKDSIKNSLLFDTGINSIKRLTDSNGVNDTQFIIKDSATATLQSNGFVTFTLNTPYAGGNEKLNYSTGTLSDVNELKLDISLSTEAYSANQTGTITASGTTVTGTGTTFTSDFAVNDFIRSASSGAVRRITDIASDTSLTINASLTESGVNYQRYWPQGHVMDLAGVGGSVNIISNTQFSVSTDISTSGGSGSQTVYGDYEVIRTGAVPITKNINKDTFVKIDCSSAGVDGPFNLGLIDVASISAIYIGSDYSESNPDRSLWFDLDTGQTLNEYGHASIVLKPQYKSNISSASRILVKLNHFVADYSAGAGFFSVDSYPLVEEGDTANSTNIHIGSIPTINGLDTRRYIDFRLQKYNTANTSTTIAGATVNPAAANSSYIKASTGSYLPYPDSNFQADVEYYLSRIDILSITKDGELVITEGQASSTPKSPISPVDSMPIANIYVPGYPSLTTREGEEFSRIDIKTRISLLYNKGYDMKDIGALESRLNRLEYYTALNLLEQSTKDLTITDSNGLDRFKNGFFAEPFASHNLGNVSDFEYKISIDPLAKVGRPFFDKHSIDYQLNSNNSTNIQVSGSKVTLPYSPVLYAEQPYATKFRNCTESVWQWNADVTLYPEHDHFRNEVSIPAVNVDIDLATPFEQFANSPFGTTFGDWRTVNTSTSTSTSTFTPFVGEGDRATGNITTTTTALTNQQRVESVLNVDVSSQNYNFGSFVKDISINPYMRSREVAFIATGLKPNTEIHAFFDRTNVDEHCAQGTLSGVTNVLEGQENRIVSRTVNYGTTMVTDGSGTLYGIFRIPDDSFRVGDREFILCDVDDMDTGSDAILTSGKSIYNASNMSISSQEITLNTRTPNISSTSSIASRTLVDTSQSVQEFQVNGGEGGDPISESFPVEAPNSTVVFFDKLDLYFKSKDDTMGVTVYITEMSAGVPNSKKIIAKKHLTSAEVNVSDDASAVTTFNFDDVFALTTGNFYCFQVKPDSDSPEYNIWMAETGQSDVVTGQQVFSNPYIGVAFVSANQNTWTALQSEDIKFSLYRASFNTGTGTASFENEDDDFLTVDGLTKANSSIAVQVGDIVYTANSTDGLLTSNTDPVGYVQKVDDANDTLIIHSSNGLFAANDRLRIHREFHNDQSAFNSNTLIASGNVVSVDNKLYSAVVPRFATISPAGSKIDYSYKGTDETYNLDDNFFKVVPETENEKLDKMRNVVSKSNEIVSMSGNKSSLFNISLTSTNDYVSPVIDMIRKSSFVIENIINNDSTDEHTRYGNALSRYLSKPIVLAEGQDAEDIQVYVGAYRPFGSDIKVYAKFLHNEDYESINDKVWTELDYKTGEYVYSTTGNTTDYREYSFGIPTTAPVTNAAYLNENNSGVVEYTDAAGEIYQGYKTFMIKVVLLSSSKAQVPLLTDTRAVCLQI